MRKPKRSDVGGVATRLLRDGAGPIGIVFLHGGMPGLTPYCAGAHVWETGLEPFVRGGFAVMALDLPGAGGSALRDGVAPTIEGQGAAAMAVLERLGSGPCHVVGHAEGGLVALWLAMERPGFIRSVTVTARRVVRAGGRSSREPDPCRPAPSALEPGGAGMGVGPAVVFIGSHR